MQTKFILHGGYTRYENDLNRTFFEEFMRDIPNDGKALIVLFASLTEDVKESFQTLTQKLQQASPAKEVTFINATREGFVDQLKQADAVFLQGGHTPKLLDALKEYPTLSELLKNRTIAGSSAGAYALARYGTAHTGAEVREGFGILPVRVVCHYESQELPPSPTSLAAIKSIAPELELVLLHDCEWRVFRV